jgi:hypothetical protein
MGSCRLSYASWRPPKQGGLRHESAAFSIAFGLRMSHAELQLDVEGCTGIFCGSSPALRILAAIAGIPEQAPDVEGDED